MRRIIILFFFICQFNSIHAGYKFVKEFYQITIYHFTTADQEKTLDLYLEKSLIPALHLSGIRNVGVFKSLANDTVLNKLLYIIIPLKSFEMVNGLAAKLTADTNYQKAGAEYLLAKYSSPPYTRMEVIISEVFPLAPQMKIPKLQSDKKDRVYELRSYESPTENIFANKVYMFNEGGEIDLFKKLDFNAVFYSSVIAGGKMPNLMYMTCFENMKDRDEHWKKFVEDPFWKELSSLPQYQNNVSHIDITFLHPAAYSDY